MARESPRDGAMADRLGPVILKCRDLSWADQQLDAGVYPIGIRLLVPFAASLLIAGCALPVLAVGLWIGGFDVEKLNNDALLWGFLAIVTALCFSVFCWRIFRRQSPRTSLALHRSGIRYRREVFLFDDLSAIQFGRESRGLEAALLALFRLIGKVSASYREIVETAEATNSASLTLVQKDGRTRVLRRIALSCDPDDFKQFVDLLRSRHASRCPGIPPGMSLTITSPKKLCLPGTPWLL